MAEHDKVDWTKPIEHVTPGTAVLYHGPQANSTDEFRHLVLVGADMRGMYVNDFGCSRGEKGRARQLVRNVIEKTEEPAKKPDDTLLGAVAKLSGDVLETFNAVTDLSSETEKVSDRLNTVTGHLSKVVAPRLEALQKSVDATRDGTGQPLASLSAGMEKFRTDFTKAVGTLNGLDKAIRDELISFKLEQKNLGKETLRRLDKVSEALTALPTSLNRSFGSMQNSLFDRVDGVKAGLDANLRQVLAEWGTAEDARYKRLYDAVVQLADALRASSAGADSSRLSDIDRRLKTLETDTRARLDGIQTTLDLLLEGAEGRLFHSSVNGSTPPATSDDTPPPPSTQDHTEPSGPVAHHYQPYVSPRRGSTAAALKLVPALEIDGLADQKIVTEVSNGKDIDISDELMESLRNLANYGGVTKISFGTSALKADKQRLGQLRFRKDVNVTGFCLRGYDHDSIRDIFVYCKDPEAKAAVLSTLQD